VTGKQFLAFDSKKSKNQKKANNIYLYIIIYIFIYKQAQYCVFLFGIEYLTGTLYWFTN
jgi:cytochrome c oxidase subunit IV